MTDLSQPTNNDNNNKKSLREDRVATVVRFRPPRAETTQKWTPDAFPDLDKFSAVLSPDATNANLFETVGKPLVEEMMQGKNTCTLCYGQTGSGKTHSTVGPVHDPGLIPRCVHHLFEQCNANKRSMRFRVSVSIVEVYKEEIRDLIPSEASRRSNNNRSSPPQYQQQQLSTLQMREKNGVFFLPDCNIRVCSNAEAVLREVNAAFANRTTGNSYLNDVSSRAHAVCTISLAAETNTKGTAPMLMLSRMSFVDLCGTEVLSDKFGSFQQEETKSINKSLFSLRGCVSALAEKSSFIPYRDSVLTMLLKATLSPNSMNCIVCTCSPDPEDYNMSSGAISFGNIAQRIEQKIELRIFLREHGGGTKLKMKDKADEELIAIDTSAKIKTSADALPVVATRITVPTRQGDVSAIMWAKKGQTPQQVIATGKVGLALHAFGGGCEGNDMEDLAKATITCGGANAIEGVFAIDFPGFGKTPGKRQTSRTEHMWNDGESMEIVVDALDFATDSKRTRQVVIIGWDWGGNMALSLAISAFKSRIRCLVLFHPSWTAPREALAAIKVPVLLLWIPSDTLHLLAHGRQMAKLISKSKLVQIKLPAGKEIGGRGNFDIFGMCAVQTEAFMKGLPALAAKPKPKAKAAAAAAPTASAAAPAAVSSALSSPSSSDAEQEELDGGGGAFGDEEEEGMSLAESQDFMSDYSRESSFLGLLLADPEVVDAIVADERSKKMKAETKLAAKNASPVGDALAESLFAKLAALRITGATGAASSSTTVSASHITQLMNAISSICTNSTKTRLALAYAVLGRDRVLRSSIIGAVGLCPVVLPYFRAEQFAALGMIPTVPAGITDAHKTWARSKLFRYLPGRTVVLALPFDIVCQDMRNPRTIGAVVRGVTAAKLQSKFDSLSSGNNNNNNNNSRTVGGGGGGRGGRFFWSFRCMVVKPISKSQLLVAVETEDGSANLPLTVSIDDLERMNAPTAFPPFGSSKDSLVFEDAIRGRYKDVALRVKIMQCAAAIQHIVPQLDFAAAFTERQEWTPSSSPSPSAPKNNQLLKLQMECLREIRKCVDIQHHIQMGRDPNRALVPDVGNLSQHGSWHCHGTASVVAGVLLPFASLLGLEVRQRDGYFAKDLSEKWDGRPELSNDHTWLEVTFQPSGANFVCDPSFSPQCGEEILITYREAYSVDGCRYPSRDLTSAAKSGEPMLMDGAKCVVLHCSGSSVAEAAGKEVRDVAAMPKLVASPVDGTLSFMP